MNKENLCSISITRPAPDADQVANIAGFATSSTSADITVFDRASSDTCDGLIETTRSTFWAAISAVIWERSRTERARRSTIKRSGSSIPEEATNVISADSGRGCACELRSVESKRTRRKRSFILQPVGHCGQLVRLGRLLLMDTRDAPLSELGTSLCGNLMRRQRRRGFGRHWLEKRNPQARCRTHASS